MKATRNFNLNLDFYPVSIPIFKYFQYIIIYIYLLFSIFIDKLVFKHNFAGYMLLNPDLLLVASLFPVAYFAFTI